MGLCNGLQGDSSAFVATERTNQRRFCAHTSGDRDK